MTWKELRKLSELTEMEREYFYTFSDSTKVSPAIVVGVIQSGVLLERKDINVLLSIYGSPCICGARMFITTVGSKHQYKLRYNSLRELTDIVNSLIKLYLN